MIFDPKILNLGAVAACYHIEAGARKFNDYTEVMIKELGDNIKPYLKCLYEGIKRFPGMEEIAKDMDSTEYVDSFNFDIQNNSDMLETNQNYPTTMKITPEMKEELLSSPMAMQILISMADYKKGLLLELIQDGTILKYLWNKINLSIKKICSPEVQEQLKDLPPGGEQEVKNLLITGIDPDTPMSEWTAPEARIVNQWWEKEFPEEPNPFPWDESRLPERLGEESELNKLAREFMEIMGNHETTE